MSIVRVRRRLAWQAGARLLAAAACLLAVAGGCGGPARSGPARSGGDRSALASGYLAIALPANRQLDTEVDAYRESAHRSLLAAESALRAEAATERRFDRLLLTIPFPARIAAIAHALVLANQARINLTEQQARSGSIAGLLALTGRHRAADAAVEAQVRIIRQDLGLPPPDRS